jgi:hypothetical protein
MPLCSQKRTGGFITGKIGSVLVELKHATCVRKVSSVLVWRWLKESQEWLGQLVAGLSPRRPGFDPRPVHVGFVVDKVALGQVFPPSTSASPCQFYSTGAPLLGKMGKMFITGLHKQPEGCGTSVASAAGPFFKKNSSRSRACEFWCQCELCSYRNVGKSCGESVTLMLCLMKWRIQNLMNS